MPRAGRRPHLHRDGVGEGLSYANEKTRHLLHLAEGEDQVAVQLFGHEPDVMADQARWIEQEMGRRFPFLDLGMGFRRAKIGLEGGWVGADEDRPTSRPPSCAP